MQIRRNTLKYTATLLMAIVIMVTGFGMPVHASDDKKEDPATQGITFEEVPFNVQPTKSDGAASTEIGPQPKISSNGTFSFWTNGSSGGLTLLSSEYYVSSSSSQILMTPYSDEVSSYTCYLEEKKWYGWPTIETVSYAVTNGTELGYTFTGLSTSKRYRFRLYSPDGVVHGTGKVTNYVHP